METIVNGTFIGFCLTFSLIPYVLPVITPTRRWFAGATIVVGALLSALWIQDGIARSQPGFHGGPGDAIGTMIGDLLTIGFVAGVSVRAITLFLQSRDVNLLYRVALSVAGLPITIATISWIDTLSRHRW